MPQPHGRAGLVALLPARPAGAIGVHRALVEQLRIAELGPGRPAQIVHIDSTAPRRAGFPTRRADRNVRLRPCDIRLWPLCVSSQKVQRSSTTTEETMNRNAIALTVLCAVALAARGDSTPGDYVADGQLKHAIVIRDVQGGFAGLTGRMWKIDTDGS